MNLLATPRGRKFLFGALYLSEGAPIGYIWWALPTKLRSVDVPVEQIASLTALLVLPWALKFLWAPLVDVLRTPRWSLRSWILAMQILMGVSILPLLHLDFHADLHILALVLVIHAVAAATQDVSIDALCITSSALHERGALNGWMQVGMLTGRSLLGGGALVMEEIFGERSVILILIGTVWSSMILLALFTSDSVHSEPPLKQSVRQFTQTLREVLAQRATWVGFAFALIGGTAYEAVGSVAGPFLIDRDLNKEEVGYFFAIPSIVSMIAGSLIGGYLSDRFERRKSVMIFIAFLAGVILLLAAADLWGNQESATLIVALLSLMYFGIGLFTASSYGLFMDLTNPKLGATQFSAFMGGTNLCESWSAFAVGKLIVASSYGVAFGTMAVVSLIAIPFLKILPKKTNSENTGTT